MERQAVNSSSECVTTADQMPGCPFPCRHLCLALGLLEWDTCGRALAVQVALQAPQGNGHQDLGHEVGPFVPLLCPLPSQLMTALVLQPSTL